MNIDATILKENTKKPELAIEFKDHTPFSSGIYSRNAKWVQHPQIGTCDTPHKQHEG